MRSQRLLSVRLLSKLLSSHPVVTSSQRLSGQTLCVFCATRLGVEAGAPLQAQRRHLQSGRVSRRPPATAAATQEDEPTEYQSRPREAPRFGGGWAQSSFSSELTPEEERQRQVLRERAQKEREAVAQTSRSTLVRKVEYASSPGYNSPARRENLDHSNTTLRNTLTDHGAYPSRRTEGLRVRRYESRPDQFQTHDPRKVDDPPYNSDIAKTWLHVKKRGDRSTQTPDVPKGTPNVPSNFETETDLALVEARLEREKRSRNGGFVGFGETGTGIDSSHKLRRVASVPLVPHIQTGTSEDPNLRVRHIDYNPIETFKPRRVTLTESIDKSWMEPSDTSGGEPRQTTVSGYRLWTPPHSQLGKSIPTQEPELSQNIGFTEDTVSAQQLEERRLRREKKGKRQALDDTPLTNVQGPYERTRRPRRHRRSDFDEDQEEDGAKFERRRQRKQEKVSQRAVAAPTPIYLPEFISVANLATALKVKLEDFIYTMQSMGFEGLSNDHVFDGETAGLIAVEYNFDPVIDQRESQDLQARAPPEDASILPQRPPVVTIMGHVDHGKTTLLDWLRKSSVAASEHGGITQHIGAFSVPMPSGKIITFLDTPGHAAFLSMRQRGANVTDVVILVVAADDSVKPQTIEAIKHAKAANVPIIVAANKIDKEGASIERVKQDLARYGVELEDHGGDTQVVGVSGKTGQGMEELEEAVVALADILDIRADRDGPAEGWVLEATTNKAGRVATVLVRRGTMRPGDVIVAGSTWARIRSLRNEAGVQIAAAGPGTPVQIDGWREQPIAGDEILEAPDEQRAKSVVDIRRERDERLKMAADMEAVNESRRLEHEEREREKQLAGEKTVEPEEEQQHSGIKEVFFIVKADVSGSVEAVLNSVSALGNEEVRAHILRSGVGPVSEFDVEHAAVAKGHIISFSTQVEANISRIAEAAGVSIIDDNIIYRLVDEVKARLSEHLTPLKTQRVVGEAEIAQIFEIKGKGKSITTVAGCKIRNGVVQRNAKVKVLREKDIIYQGKDFFNPPAEWSSSLNTLFAIGTLSTLKNVKKDVAEMRKGNDCGLSFEGWGAFQVGDQVQCYEEKVEKRYL